MIDIKKVQAEDFDRIYPLLQELNASTVTKDVWRRLFTRHWDGQGDFCGYMIADNDNAVGFIGTLFSERVINNKCEKICNLTSWVVKKEYHGESLSLLFPVLELKNHTVTDFTASPAASSALKAFGFRQAAGKRFVIPAVCPGGLRTDRTSVEYEPEAIRDCLSRPDLRIFSDHFKFRCRHIVIKARDGYCYIVFRQKRIRGISLAEAHYTSNREIFLKYITRLSFDICRRLKAWGILIDGRYLKGQRPRCSVALRPACPIIYKSASLEEQDIDTLYSELFVLDI